MCSPVMTWFGDSEQFPLHETTTAQHELEAKILCYMLLPSPYNKRVTSEQYKTCIPAPAPDVTLVIDPQVVFPTEWYHRKVNYWLEE